jgi:hypothetical protein
MFLVPTNTPKKKKKKKKAFQVEEPGNAKAQRQQRAKKASVAVA